MQHWSPISWKTFPNPQSMPYADPDELDRIACRIANLPPLVTSWEIERLKALIASAQCGERFLLQGGDCAETLEQCNPGAIERTLAILLKMSLVLILGSKKPVVRVGRIAGQYGKPRSSLTETCGGVTLPSYFGDLVNRPERTPEARRPNPQLLLACYEHAAMTLNFVRSLSGGGFADLHHPEVWDLSFFDRAGLPAPLRESYLATTQELADALRFMEALGEHPVCELSRVEFYTSHEGFHLHYESAQTKVISGQSGHYDLTTHMPWIGARTRTLSGAHVEFFRGIRNPIGVKIGPDATPDEVLGLCQVLNPDNEPGRLVLVTRMGAARVKGALPRLLDAVRRADRRVLWVCDPMHGNTVTVADGKKTRSFEAIASEIDETFEAHSDCGTILGGVHLELSGDDVTECIGGGVRETDLSRAYETRCDPRLNHAQALEMAYVVARRMRSECTNGHNRQFAL
ncbi:MAG: 3-deoxy-7-phosphoheptulonate synthase [Polyangiaceae bacterium]|nr:3-deoxy-7-phosphoheptulonate synthase [Polyangiaceae bacterium]